MAEVNVGTAGPLPPTCVDCGAVADHVRPETFSWTPSWALGCWVIGILPGLLAVAATRRRAALDLPVCGRHAARATGRPRAVWVAAGLGLLAGLAGAVVSPDPDGVGDLLMLGGVGVMVLAGLAALVLGSSGVRAGWITDRKVRLVGVSDEFARAVTAGPVVPFAPPGLALQTAKYLRPE